MTTSLIITSLLATTTATANLDLVLVIDRSGSMSQAIKALKDALPGLYDELAEQRPRATVRVGIVAFRDEHQDTQTTVVALSADRQATLDSMSRLHGAGGGHDRENIYEALRIALVDMNWNDTRPTERRIVLLSDALPLSPSIDTRPSHLVVQALKERIAVHAITPPETARGTLSFMREFTALADGTHHGLVAGDMHRQLASNIVHTCRPQTSIQGGQS